jgi:copper(I)-binding protein
MMNRRALLLASVPLLLTPLVARNASAHSFILGAIEIGHPWAKPSATEAAALFMAFDNTGVKPDRLISATTPIATAVIFRDRGGDPVEYFELRPNRPLPLRPGGRYIALHGLAIDDEFPLTLNFAEAHSITVTVVVEPGPEEPGTLTP